MQSNFNSGNTLPGNVNGDYVLRGMVSMPKIVYKDSYMLAVKNGFVGTIEEWLESLKGEPGSPGEKGDPGYTPVKGVDYFDGQDGQPGKDGSPGKDGDDGYTPVKGVDYWTEADKAEMVSSVIAQVQAMIDAALGGIENGTY